MVMMKAIRIHKQENGGWKIHRYLFASSQVPH
jgi:hypothetical protein